MKHVDIWSKGEVIQYLQQLLKLKQIKDCKHLKVRQEYLQAFYPECIKNLASRKVARNVTTDSTACRAPSSYIWPVCPDKCQMYSQSKDFFASLTVEEELPIEDVRITKEGVFFKGQYFDALQKVQEILSKAKRGIVIIDSYINQDVLNLLTCKGSTVEAKILTKKVTPDLKTATNAFNKQYGKLLIRVSQAFHDRFIIIDDLEYYHFGASIKDLGNRGFMFSRIEEAEVIETLKKKWQEEWAKALV